MEVDTIKLWHGNDYKMWYFNGKLHRDGGEPAVERTNGHKEWYANGQRHRECDFPAIEHTHLKMWYVYDQRHRENDQPAVVQNDGHKEWWVYGQRHRENDKPAIEYSNGHKYWFLKGVNITSFRSKYMEVRKVRAQKKIYFWIIQRLYRPGSDSSKRLVQQSWKKLDKLNLM